MQTFPSAGIFDKAVDWSDPDLDELVAGLRPRDVTFRRLSKRSERRPSIETLFRILLFPPPRGNTVARCKNGFCTL